MLRRLLMSSAALALINTPAFAETLADSCEGQDCSGKSEAPLRLYPVEVAGLSAPSVAELTDSVSVLTEADLVVRQSVNPADQLRAAAGVAVSRSGGVGSLTQVRIRGAEANHTLVLYDGFEVSDPVNGETDFGLLTALPTSRIEVLRGEASSIYGSDAIGGVVDLFPGSDKGWNGRIEGGSMNTASGSAGWTGSLLSAAVSGFTTDGIDISGNGGEKDGSEALSGLLRGTVALNDNWSLSGLALVRQSEAQLDTDSDYDGLLDDADLETKADQQLFGAVLSSEYGAFGQEFRASYGEVVRDNKGDGQLLDTATGERTKLSWKPSYKLGAHTLTGLLDSEKENYDRHDVQYGGLSDASEEFDTLGIAAEYRFDTDALNLVASLRHDDNDGRFEDADTWRVGAAYNLPGEVIRLRASAGSGVKNPTFTELFGFFPGSFVGNPDLKPEESTSWEAGFDWQAGRASGSVVYYSAKLKNEIYTAYNVDFTSTAANRAAKSERSGVEAEARMALTDAVTLSGQVSVFDSTNDTGEDEIRVPKQTASLAVLWAPEDAGWHAGAAVDFVGEQDDFDFGSFPSRRVTLDSYFLVSANAEYPVTDRISLTLRGENLLDEDISDVYGYATPGAAVYLGLKLR